MNMLELLIYIENHNREKNALFQKIDLLDMDDKPVSCPSIEALTSRLINRKGQQTICILALDSKEKLAEIQDLDRRGLFRDVRVIVIIPNDDKDFLMNAFSLHPRYLTFKDSDYSDISKVLLKMKGRPPMLSEHMLQQEAG